MMVVMMRTGSVLKTAATPKGILNLEFAYDTTATRVITTAWSPSAAPGGQDLITAAERNTWYDFGFLFFYALFLCNACYFLAAQLRGSARVGRLLGRGALVAGGLDILENIGMLLTLDGTHQNYIAIATTFFASIKWMLALLALLYILVAGAMVLYKKLSRKA